jgi:ubiquinol-cytochrome c reductase iron-sulfur subunit
VVENVVAYSKVCTHAGCPVALYREQDDALFCPCHQSTFDPSRGAVPTFGPAARALPQLPLGLDDQGYLVALDDFQAQVGPAFD